MKILSNLSSFITFPKVLSRGNNLSIYICIVRLHINVNNNETIVPFSGPQVNTKDKESLKRIKMPWFFFKNDVIRGELVLMVWAFLKLFDYFSNILIGITITRGTKEERYLSETQPNQYGAQLVDVYFRGKTNPMTPLSKK